MRLSVFPIPAGGERTVRLEYTEVLAADQGLVRYRHPLGREAQGLAEIESLTARIEIRSPTEIKAVYSPTHDVSVDRPDATTAIVGYEGRRCGRGRRLRPLLLHYRGPRRPQPAHLP